MEYNLFDGKGKHLQNSFFFFYFHLLFNTYACCFFLYNTETYQTSVFHLYISRSFFPLSFVYISLNVCQYLQISMWVYMSKKSWNGFIKEQILKCVYNVYTNKLEKREGTKKKQKSHIIFLASCASETLCHIHMWFCIM